jgi:voltage-gated potassium channel
VDGAAGGGTGRRLVALYYLLPLDHPSVPAGLMILVTGLVVFIALVAFHVRSIMRSPFPQLRAVEALAINVPLFLLLFAGTYVALAALSSRNFGGHLSHTDGLYFAVTVFSTVGFGDITAKTGTARLVVTGQMITDLIILGLPSRSSLAQPGAVSSKLPANSTPTRRDRRRAG